MANAQTHPAHEWLRAHLIGCDRGLREQSELIRTVSPRRSTVLILGESGSGKEMLARAIHESSLRADGPFIPVDCTNLSGPLFESQLFGHVRGSFTGAIRDGLGFFRAADGGSIFLDEIGELDEGLQSKLLRVLQDRCVWPVGAVEGIPVDIRVIAATNRDVRQLVADGRFREDLYYRLSVVCITAPPLRARREDVIPLANHFLEKQAALYEEPRKELTPEVEEALLRYHWPGNVRELANVMERGYIMASGAQITLDLLSADVLLGGWAGTESGVPTLDQVERAAVVAALKSADWRKRRAAGLLAIDYRRLNRLMARHDIQMPSPRKRSRG